MRILLLVAFLAIASFASADRLLSRKKSGTNGQSDSNLSKSKGSKKCGGKGDACKIVHGLQPDCYEDDPDKFNICLETASASGEHEDWMELLAVAKARWEEVIVKDTVPPQSLGDGSPAIDDIRIVITGVAPDDWEYPPTVVAVASPGIGYEMNLTSTVPSTLNPDLTKNRIMPIVSDMMFQTKYLDYLVRMEVFEEMIMHEMGHALGIGSDYWGWSDLNDGGEEYVGLAGLAAWRFLGCSGDLPPAPTGSAKAASHWRQNCLGKELMSSRFLPFDGFHKLSIVTIGTMMDLGYVVNFGAADDFGLDDLSSFCGAFCPETENRRKLNPTNIIDEDLCENISAEDTEIVMKVATERLSKAREQAPAIRPKGQVSQAGEVVDIILEVGKGFCGVQVTWAETQRWKYEATN